MRNAFAQQLWDVVDSYTAARDRRETADLMRELISLGIGRRISRKVAMALRDGSNKTAYDLVDADQGGTLSVDNSSYCDVCGSQDTVHIFASGLKADWTCCGIIFHK